MRFKRSLIKKRAVAIGAVLLTIPFLFGFTADEGKKDNPNINAQTSDGTVNAPVDDKEKSATEDKKLLTTNAVRITKRSIKNTFNNLRDAPS